MNIIKSLKDKIVWKETAPSIILLSNTFTWYILVYLIFYFVINELSITETEKISIFATYFISVAITAILGSKLFPRARIKALKVWLFMGSIVTLSLLSVTSGGIQVNILVALFLGASVGTGLPSCLSYFAEKTSVEKRAFVGGLIWSIVGFIMLIFFVLLIILSQLEIIIFLTLWRFLGGLVFSYQEKGTEKCTVQNSPSYFKLIRKREILLYLFPWLMFSVINYTGVPILEKIFGEEFIIVQLAEWAIIGIVAIIGGFFADIVGRKRVVIFGFVMLGIEYATLSIFYSSPASMYLILILDGITWGLLFSVFLTTLWGDLGENQTKEKYYVLGGLPILLANFAVFFIAPIVSPIAPSTTFSIASFFLFLAILPLIYAPETLPEKKIKERELKNYLENAQKVRDKYS